MVERQTKEKVSKQETSKEERIKGEETCLIKKSKVK